MPNNQNPNNRPNQNPNDQAQKRQGSDQSRESNPQRRDDSKSGKM